MQLDPVVLTGRNVELVPLSHAHCSDLSDAVKDGELWNIWYTPVPSPDQMAAEIDRRLNLQIAGSMLPFTVLDGPGGRPVGMTTYMNADPAGPRIEIGYTWYAARVQRTALNTEAKFLLLSHAFEVLEVIAVEIRAHFLNYRSRRAIERLGAKLDGVLRYHRRYKDGSFRDTCVYSITMHEWLSVRTNLSALMNR